MQLPSICKAIIRIFLFNSLIFSHILSASEEEFEPAEVFHGERLFLETRFAEYFYQYIHQGGDYNQPLEQGDAKLDKTYRFFGLPPYQIPFATSPFKGSSFSCRTCHMVDEHLNQKELGMRAYSDFASRSPLSARNDKQTVTVRNSPQLISSFVDKDYLLFHADGEFSSLQELIIGTLTQRNFGWLPNERALASEHICNVIKNDNGNGDIAQEFGSISYTEMLSGKYSSGEELPTEYLIDSNYQINVNKSSCNEILQAIASLLEVYISDLQFSQDELALSPYDTFLTLNQLPVSPQDNESDLEYSARLLSLINSLEKNNTLKFVTKNENTENGQFRFHDQAYKFSNKELEGLKVFFNQDNHSSISTGNCIACHAAPHFTDFKFHNIGVSQVEYEAIHGINSFNKLPVPNNAARNKNANTYLPATNIHPDRKGVFRKVAQQSNSQHTDLGAWNILFNDDFPNPQESLLNIFCPADNKCSSKDIALQRSLATFKTPTLRNLGHTAPYMHNGQISDLHAVMGFYLNASKNSLNGQMRNPDSELQQMEIKATDIDNLVHFLFSLYEDYH
ncbi:MAG: hypothetical protein AB8C40_04690 [Gammaproteobacteria bacterium]